MKTKLEIIGSYNNYLKVLNTKGTDVFKAYEKMYQYIESEVVNVDKNLRQLLWSSLHEETLQVVRKMRLSFKGEGVEWDKRSVDECFRYIDLLSVSSENDNKTQFSINFHKLFNLFERIDSPNLRLYCIYQYRRREFGYYLLTHDEKQVEKLLKASTEEEVEDILNGATNKKVVEEDPLLNEADSVPILKLFELFNPKNLDETDECFQKAESMHASGKLNKEDFLYVRDILLLPRRTFYKNGGTWDEASKKRAETVKTVNYILQGVDGEEFIDDEEELETATS